MYPGGPLATFFYPEDSLFSGNQAFRGAFFIPRGAIFS